ncbi:MAG: type III PLP-dependent enzyme [Lentisphaeria bacterium]|nr:type III PLP-dependent enzyme [Lentisphaeria bacterium]
MSVDPLDYYSRTDFDRMISASRQYETPFVLFDLDQLRRKYLELKQNFPYAKIHYAVKANPSCEVLKLLAELGSNFDIASIYELDRVMSLGVAPDRISYGNTIKKPKDIRYAYERGIRLFASDSKHDLDNLAKEAPGARVFVRILVEGGESADWPLSRKFGCHPDLAADLILYALKLKLQPCGVSFHVGSQQREIGNWNSALVKVRYIFDFLESQGIKMTLINMGGGFPANYISRTSPLEMYASEISRFLREDFSEQPEIILEPGRSLAADPGILVSEVVLIAEKAHLAVDKWLYLDAGKFNGLAETMDECIKYPLYSEAPGEDCTDYIIAGPTCDSQDVLYENFRNPLPSGIRAGDRVYFLSAGAYTASYASVEFNGFKPIPMYFLDK